MSEPSFLQKIVSITEARVQLRKKALGLSELKARLGLRQKPLDFRKSFEKKTNIAVIAEVKGASPSQGVIKENLDAVETALAYQKAGAAAISVLTEPEYFGGSLENLSRIRLQIPELPLLQKDFILDEYQIYEAFTHGADAILLMLSVLGEKRAKEFQVLAQSLGLAALVEVHTEEEMQMALRMKANLIGVNNRNLQTLKVSLEVSRQLASMIPSETVVVSESGLETREQLLELKNLGYHGFLIGTSLMRTPDPGLALGRLIQAPTGQLQP
jgi:indole-3-glycerol phosphate synthase